MMVEIPGWKLIWKLTVDFCAKGGGLIRSIEHGKFDTADEASLEYDTIAQKLRDAGDASDTEIYGARIEMEWDKIR